MRVMNPQSTRTLWPGPGLLAAALVAVSLFTGPAATAEEQQCPPASRCTQQQCRRDTRCAQQRVCPRASTAGRACPDAVAPADRPATTRNRSAGERPRSGSEVDLIAEVLQLDRGMVVAEVGAGNGRFSVRLADYVGPSGQVYANELGARRVRGIEQMIAQSGRDNVFAIEGSVNDTRLPDDEIDAVMMRLVYHMMTEPEPMNRSFHRALRPGGTLLVVDNYPQRGSNAPGVPANRSGMGIDPDITVAEVTAAGFEFVRIVEQWPNVGYALVFRKPAG